jgi:hypothetical protein
MNLQKVCNSAKGYGYLLTNNNKLKRKINHDENMIKNIFYKTKETECPLQKIIDQVIIF